MVDRFGIGVPNGAVRAVIRSGGSSAWSSIDETMITESQKLPTHPQAIYTVISEILGSRLAVDA